jgi:hypothetical protein
MMKYNTSRLVLHSFSIFQLKTERNLQVCMQFSTPITMVLHIAILGHWNHCLHLQTILFQDHFIEQAQQTQWFTNAILGHCNHGLYLQSYYFRITSLNKLNKLNHSLISEWTKKLGLQNPSITTNHVVATNGRLQRWKTLCVMMWDTFSTVVLSVNFLFLNQEKVNLQKSHIFPSCFPATLNSNLHDS